MDASNPAFEEWWKTLPMAWNGYKGIIEQAFDAGHLAAVKAHDASGCPRIFMEDQS
jgi:hypothetical protein